jgi:hypothetical protein
MGANLMGVSLTRMYFIGIHKCAPHKHASH